MGVSIVRSHAVGMTGQKFQLLFRKDLENRNAGMSQFIRNTVGQFVMPFVSVPTIPVNILSGSVAKFICKKVRGNETIGCIHVSLVFNDIHSQIGKEYRPDALFSKDL